MLEGVVDSGAASLADVLDARYEEITGPRITSLRRLFDVSRVPLSGFDPPKFSTAYDHLVDEPLMAVYDRTLAENPWLVLAAGSDLNVYAPVHARPLCADWTGDPAQDLLGNRIKRILTDNTALVRANRVGIGRELPHRVLTRAEMRAAGADLSSPPAASSAASCRPTRATPARSSPSCRSPCTSTASAGAPRSSAGTRTASPPERGAAPGAATLPASP